MCSFGAVQSTAEFLGLKWSASQQAFDGRLNVMMSSKAGSLTVKELAEIGVARCSVGPALQFTVADAVTKAASDLLTV